MPRLCTRLKEGQAIRIGSAVVSFVEDRSRSVLLQIEAPQDLQITKIHLAERKAPPEEKPTIQPAA
jgi:sRNA-binding carbon storage regulator CsrA